MKKKILESYRFQGTQAKHVQLQIMEFYPGQPEEVPIPVFHDYSFRHMIGFLLMNDRKINIKAIIDPSV